MKIQKSKTDKPEVSESKIGQTKMRVSKNFEKENGIITFIDDNDSFVRIGIINGKIMQVFVQKSDETARIDMR